jgi:hypothetical protein
MPIVTHEFLDFLKRAPVSSGVCMCGGSIGENGCGEPHTSVDQWDYSLDKHLAGVVNRRRRAVGKPGPRYVIVEASREDEAALRESWETGEPVEIAGVRFEMAVIARRRGWFSPALVRGVEMA